MTKEKSVGVDVIGTMTVNELIDFGLNFEFLTNEKLSTYFKYKTIKKIPDYILGLDNLLSSIENFGSELESKLFDWPKKIIPYTYGSNLSNFVFQILEYLVKNIMYTKDHFEIFTKVLAMFKNKWMNIKNFLMIKQHFENSLKSIDENVRI